MLQWSPDLINTSKIYNQQTKPMRKNHLILILTIFTITSCGRSKAEIELEKARLELEQTKLELAEKEKTEELNIAKGQKIHEQKIQEGTQKLRRELNDWLEKAGITQAEAEYRLKNAQKFKIGRSSSEKKKQIEKAQTEYQQTTQYIQNIEIEMEKLKSRQTFDFQKTPEDLMKYIFKSAKSGDFSNFRYLCDPYAETDMDVKSICYAELFMEQRKKDLTENFGAARIMGKPKIKENNAVVEFAFGPSSNRLEKMNLVNRNGYWYLYGL